MTGAAAGDAEQVLDDAAEKGLTVGEMAKGGGGLFAGGGAGGGFGFGQVVEGHTGPGGDHEAQGAAVVLDGGGVDVGAEGLPDFAIIADDDAAGLRRSGILGLFGLDGAAGGVFDGDVPEVGGFVAVDAHAILQPHGVVF